MMFGHTQPTEDSFESGVSRFEIPLTQNVWTKIAGHNTLRVSIHVQPTNPYIVVVSGEVAPSASPTLIDPVPYTPNVLTRKDSPGMVRQAWWAFTTSAGVTAIVTEESGKL